MEYKISRCKIIVLPREEKKKCKNKQYTFTAVCRSNYLQNACMHAKFLIRSFMVMVTYIINVNRRD